MLARQLAIGKGPVGLVSYLFGEGKANEHTGQRLVAGSDRLIAGYGSLDVAGSREMQASLARELDGAWRQVRRENELPLVPVEGERVRGAARADRAFHATLSLAASEGTLSDAEWARAARMFVVEMGFVDSKDGADCAWIAVHHGASHEGNDHLHVAVCLVRDDGRRADIHQSKRRTAQAGARVAGAMGKDIAFAPEVSSGIGHVPRAEYERARREQRDADRVLVRRRLAGAAWQANNEAEFVRAARAAGVLVRPRYVGGGVDRVEGYSAALSGQQKPIWFAPSKLDRSLGLPVLRERYGWDGQQQLDAVRVWREPAGAKTPGTASLRLPVQDEIRRARQDLANARPDVRWRRVAHDTSAFLGAWSIEAEGNQGQFLARASDALSKAAQPRRFTPREQMIEAAGTVLAVSAAASRNQTAAQLAVIMQMMRLVEAIAERAQAERDARAARELYERAVIPLNIQSTLVRDRRLSEELQGLDAETVQMMRDTELLSSGDVAARHGRVDWERLSPSTKRALGTATNAERYASRLPDPPAAGARRPEPTQQDTHQER